jgi:hypothetical protein
MFKFVITGIFIFLLVGIVSISFWYKNKDESLGSISLKKNIIEPQLLTIKQIDIITSNSNLYFTIQNKIN